MRRRSPVRTLLVAALAVTGLLPLTAAGAPTLAAAAVPAVFGGAEDEEARELSPELRARLDEAVQRVMREAGIPGVQVGLWLPGRGRYVRAFGVADKVTGEPMTDRLNQRIGSETKTFTATAVLQLVDEGLVGLDEPISAYLDGVPCGEIITVRELLEMRSGLFPYSADQDFANDFLGDPQRVFTPQELLAYGYKHDNMFPPGTQYQYSNSNYVLLGLLVEKLSGRSIEQFVRERITGPSGLDHTLYPEGTALPSPYAHGYTDQTLSGEVADSTHWNPSWAWSAGAMVSDLRDLKHWAKDAATGTLLSPATQAERLKMLPTGIPGADYGLGIFNIGGWIGHNGSLPGYESLTIYLPEECATLVLMLNTDITAQNSEPSTLVGKAVTSIVTPDHVYDIPPGK
ncbi:D-alanyl-D-alanine carboxypeptidase [Streptomyces sp. TLI_053]|uniref:serine hydrolase domain-containing protein n=1 Tax=Streptomyces sp. TLI_053 TaxID=1855352 RepID=UPI00087CB820|nr:serine hydrolase domain-containing protein [Streptomyces sp. TLI_053]SDT81761.1 D-alanyl-D-alanine carboxypeptidase [Streptomyces sp. TLI_053]